jgi:hypothetical protein
MRFPLSAVLLFTACAAIDSPTVLVLAASAPAELTVPEGNHIVASWHASGYQIYDCVTDAPGHRTWTFHAPLAVLTADDGALVAYHFGGIDAGLPAGPYWQSAIDGSRVHGGNPISVVNPGAIPLLRLQALDTAEHGIFSPLSYIQRLETTGGVAPTGSCKPKDRAYVPYTAEYVFWAPSLPRPAVPDTIVVPEGHDVAFMGHATGVQIYECAPDANAVLTWRLRAPSAELADAAGPFATHFGGVDAALPAGPYWESIRDASRVHGGGAISAPNPGNIPLLRLTALDTAGNGIFSRITYIHRLATAGGVGPTGACPSTDARTEVPYEADYYFYVASGQ